MNFYDEIRQIITNEFNIKDSDLRTMIEEEIKQVVKSQVQRVIDAWCKDEDLEDFIKNQIKKELKNYWGGLSDTVKDTLQKVIEQKMEIRIR